MWRVGGSYRDWFLRIGTYFVRCGDALSQLINVIIFLSDNPNESLSGRSYRQKSNWFWGKMYALINWLFLWFHKDHCKKAYDADIARASLLLKSVV